MSSSSLLTVGDVNKLTYEEFIEKFGNVVEHCALFAASVCQERPFSTFEDIHEAFTKFMDSLPISGKFGESHCACLSLSQTPNFRLF